jgi:hypothetical protein
LTILLSASLSGAFGGLLASAILKLDGLGNLAGWRWIFILEGIASCFVGFLAMAMLPESLRKARFLTEEEREFAGMSAMLPVLVKFKDVSLAVNRFQMNSAAAQRTFEDAEARKSPSAIEEKDSKGSVQHVDANVPQGGIITQEVEAFEWREIRRGKI